jgi:hypothetical protein
MYQDDEKKEETSNVWNPAKELFIKQTIKYALIGYLIGIGVIALIIKLH